MQRHKDSLLWGAVTILTLLLGGGCASFRMTEPPRTATEQLLLSTVADRALASADLTIFANQRVFLDATYFDSYDSKYAIGEIRDALSRAGALLESSPANSDIIIEARAGALSTDSSYTLIGVPSTGLPIPLTGTISTPEIAFYKSQNQLSYAKIALLAYANQSRAHIYSSGPLVGKSYSDYHKILFINWFSTDIPEKQKTPKKTEKYQSWFPQYDLINLPSNPPKTNAPAANMLPANIPVTNSPPSPTNVKTNTTGP
jgi:hypothetical protein